MSTTKSKKSNQWRVEAVTVDDIKTRLIEVAKCACLGDFEAAHIAEDALYFDVLVAIASGNDNGQARELARQAIRSRELVFKRVCS